jgi:hypothetical protein
VWIIPHGKNVSAEKSTLAPFTDKGEKRRRENDEVLALR